jgi:hypothetical protein
MIDANVIQSRNALSTYFYYFFSLGFYFGAGQLALKNFMARPSSRGEF